MSNRYDGKILWVVLLLTASVIVINGITTEVSLGDESHHYRFTENIYWSGKRVPFDPLYKSGNPPGFSYNTPPLWHIILTYLWRITGGISQAVAQIYHVLFFLLLVWLTYFLAKETVGKEVSFFSAFIIATVPMVVSFSTLLYMDIPMTALSTLSFYLILKKRYIEAGISSGLAYLTKFNAGFFFPGFLFLILWNERKKGWDVLKNVTFFTLPILLIHIPDRYWRTQNITGQLEQSNIKWVLQRVSSGFWRVWGREYLNSYLTNPIDLIKYFGLPFLFLLFFYLFFMRRWDRKSATLWVPVISYLIPFIIIFGVKTDIRYLIPILPFLILLSIESVLSLGKRWRFVMISVCILQFVSTTYYVHQKRQISPEVKEGFEYIKKKVPEEALILYPEENLLMYGQRRMIWSGVGALEGYQFAKEGLYSLLWAANHKEMEHILKANHIDHILIKKSRIYDDSEDYHLGGYPQSFVEKLFYLDGWVKIFENPGLALWRRGP
ncbi:MAG: glycosyltransferase family 39 protein [Deltaproteobacteria bacterium]|nr:MAG: glycosyltransferase family 39 protein [Deltaproteobacteria bacterium]